MFAQVSTVYTIVILLKSLHLSYTEYIIIHACMLSKWTQSMRICYESSEHNRLLMTWAERNIKQTICVCSAIDVRAQKRAKSIAAELVAADIGPFRNFIAHLIDFSAIAVKYSLSCKMHQWAAVIPTIRPKWLETTTSQHQWNTADSFLLNGPRNMYGQTCNVHNRRIYRAMFPLWASGKRALAQIDFIDYCNTLIIMYSFTKCFDFFLQPSHLACAE